MGTKKRFYIFDFIKRLFLCILAMVLFLPTLSGFSTGNETVVRIGWYDSTFNSMDDLGRRSGYAYEYAQRIAVYAGWKYEYVEGSWSELMDMLIEGKIDLMTDVSYTKERNEKMLYSSLPMGSEGYYLFATLNNNTVSADDYSTFNGKKVGVNRGSIQIELFKQWEKENGVETEIVELSGTESENSAALNRGDFDFYLTLSNAVDLDTTIPLCKIASSDFYFVLNKSRTDLLPALNSAMNKIQNENPYYNQELYAKYLKTSNVNRYFSKDEVDWIAEHGRIRVGYQDNYLAFCAKDPKTGLLKGALSDYLTEASTIMSNATISFQPIAYATSEDAMEALKNGEIDCMFPSNLTDYYGEIGGFSISSSIMHTDMIAIVAEDDQRDFFEKERITVAVNAGNPNYDMFLLDHFPDWHPIYFENTPECLKAISQGKASCLLMSSFRYNNVAKLCDKYNLVSIPAGVKMDYCFAVNRSDSMLYSILNQVNSVMPESAMTMALNSYYLEEAKANEYVSYRQNNFVFIVLSLVALLFIVLFLVFLNLRSKRIAKEKQKLIAATETDSLTGLYIRSYFYEYANKLHSDNPDKKMDAIFVNVSRFHTLNAINSYNFGNKVLKTIADEIKDFISQNSGIASRNESDHFAIYCEHFDDYIGLYNRLQNAVDNLSASVNIRLCMGVMPWQEDIQPRQQIEQAIIACGLTRNLYKEQMLVFDENLKKKEEFEQHLRNDLRIAVENHEFEVYYQPIFNIQGEQPVLAGAEALVRWNHPDFGLLMPDEFISMFEQSVQICEVDNFVLKNAARQLATWKKKYSNTVPVSVNLSRNDIFDSKIEEALSEIMEKNELSVGDIKIEITESVYTENLEEFISVIEKLRQKGFPIVMDDFGSGYSSLNMLSAMPIDALKMDKGFLETANDSKKGIEMIELILDVAKSLKVPVVAEGVKDENQLELLKKFGCAMAQGFYFSKPMPADKFEETYLK